MTSTCTCTCMYQLVRCATYVNIHVHCIFLQWCYMYNKVVNKKYSVQDHIQFVHLTGNLKCTCTCTILWDMYMYMYMYTCWIAYRITKVDLFWRGCFSGTLSAIASAERFPSCEETCLEPCHGQQLHTHYTALAVQLCHGQQLHTHCNAALAVKPHGSLLYWGHTCTNFRFLTHTNTHMHLHVCVCVHTHSSGMHMHVSYIICTTVGRYNIKSTEAYSTLTSPYTWMYSYLHKHYHTDISACTWGRWKIEHV